MSSSTKFENYQAEVRQKMNALLEEFSQGKLNREQFHAIYERYSRQLELAERAIHGSDTPMQDQDDEGGTIVIREKFMGKARGMIIFGIRSGNVIETLGKFSVTMETVLPILDKFTQDLQDGHVVERVVRRVGEREWLLFVAGEFTTVVTLFLNEPSHYQTVVIQRMHRDFENANRAYFRADSLDASQLVYPFYSFVQNSLGR